MTVVATSSPGAFCFVISGAAEDVAKMILPSLAVNRIAVIRNNSTLASE